MKIIVTGAAGFIGSHLVDYLVHQNHQVTGVDNLSGGFRRNISPKIKFYRIDLRDKHKTVDLITKIKPQLIYHLAADASEGRSQFTPLLCTENNYTAYLNVLVGVVKAQASRILVASSMSVYGNQKPPFSENTPPRPVDIYGIAKYAMEQATITFTKVYGFKYTIVRPHNVYGPRQNLADPYRNVVGIFINRMLQNKHFFIYGDSNQKRSFSYIDDVAPYIAKAGLNKNTINETINIGPQKAYTINQIANEVLSNFVKNINSIPKHLQPAYLPKRPLEVNIATCTDSKARKLLGFTHTIPLKKGITLMVKWAKTIGPQKTKYLKQLELTSDKLPLTWKTKLI